MLEKEFRKKIIAAANHSGIYAVPIESAVSNGFPDIVLSNHVTILVECKVVATRAGSKLFGSIFEKTQLAFYKNWWKTQSDNIWCAVYFKKEKQIGLLQLNPGYFKFKIKDVMFHITDKMVSAINWLRSLT